MEFPEFNFETKSHHNQIGSFETDDINGVIFKNSEDEEFQENKFSDTLIDEDSGFVHNNYTDLICKDYSMNSMSEMRWKTLKPFEFFQLQCDCLIDIEYFERPDDLHYWSEKGNPMFNVRPLCKIIQYEQYGAYQLDTSITGLLDFDMPIQRLYDTQTQQAYELAQILILAKQQLDQLTQINQRLRSIFTPSYLKEKLDSNFEKSYKMANDLFTQIINDGNEFVVMLILRVCSETMTYKLSMVLQSTKMSKLISNNNIELLHRLALKQSMPYIFDVRSIVSMCQNMFNQKARYQINISTLNQDIVPCELEVEKVYLSSCEISQGIFLPDICITQKFNVNPKLAKVIINRKKEDHKYLIYDNSEDLDYSNEFLNKFYSKETFKNMENV